MVNSLVESHFSTCLNLVVVAFASWLCFVLCKFVLLLIMHVRLVLEGGGDWLVYMTRYGLCVCAVS